MPITKTKTDLIGTAGAKITINPGGYSISGVLDCSGYAGILISAEVILGPTPKGGTKIEVQSSPDQIHWDTKPIPEFEITYDNNTRIMKTIAIRPELKYIRIKTTNNDPDDTVDVWVCAVGTSI